MDEIKLSVKDRLNIAQAILKEWLSAADSFELRGRVAVKVGDQARANIAQQELEIALKTIEELKKEVNQLEAEATKNVIN